MEDVTIVQLNIKLPKSKRITFKYLCDSQDSNMGEVVNNFIDYYIKTNYPKQDMTIEHANN